MIKTISIIGVGKTGSALALAFAEQAPDGYLVEVFDPNKEATLPLRQKIAQRELSPDTIWFSNSARDATWGADVVVLDLPAQKLSSVLLDIGDTPNEGALAILAQPHTRGDITKLKPFLSTARLVLAPADNSKLRRIWENAGVEYPVQRQTELPLQATLEPRKT